MNRLVESLDRKFPRLTMPKMPALQLPKLPAWRRSASSSTVAALVVSGGLRLTATKGREVNFWQHVPLPPELISRGWIADPEAFGVALREVLRVHDLVGARFVWALPGTVATARLLSVQLGGVADPNSFIAREAAWAMPVTPEDHYLYWQPLSDELDDHVFVLAVQKGAIDSLLQTCAIAGVRARAIDLKPLALLLALGQSDAVIADVERNSIDILIAVQGVPVAMRSLHLGDQLLDIAAAQAKLVDELSIAIQLYNETNPGTPLDQAVPVYLTGDLADSDLAGKVAFTTKRPTVEPVAPFPCPAGFPTGRFMANLGLLLKRA